MYYTTSENNVIKGDYAEYNKKQGIIVLKKYRGNR